MTVVPYGALPPDSERVLVHIGEIQVTQTTIRTPHGTFPVRGSFWMVRDQWQQVQKTPTWAIVCAILGFCCLTIFSLLFLLAKETRLVGSAEVMVGNGPYQYMARIPVTTHAHLQRLHDQVNYARALATQ